MLFESRVTMTSFRLNAFGRKRMKRSMGVLLNGLTSTIFFIRIPYTWFQRYRLLTEFTIRFETVAKVFPVPSAPLVLLGSGPVGDNDLWYHHILVFLSITSPPRGPGLSAGPPSWLQASLLATGPSQPAPGTSQLAPGPP